MRFSLIVRNRPVMISLMREEQTTVGRDPLRTHEMEAGKIDDQIDARSPLSMVHG
jgi:hypothetical protein